MIGTTVVRMRLPRITMMSPQTLFTRYAVAWIFLLAVALGDIVLTAAAPHQQVEIVQWASTNVANLQRHPVAALLASAVLPADLTWSLLGWLGLIALSMFGANRALGNAWIALVCLAGHVIGTAVSEGIEAYRVSHGQLPAAARTIIDVGPSYVVVSAIVVAVAFGSWPARIGAVVAFVILVNAGIFDGLNHLQVAAVGHVTAIVVAAALGSAPAWRRRQAAQARPAA
jgi:hypothetical protein